MALVTSGAMLREKIKADHGNAEKDVHVTPPLIVKIDRGSEGEVGCSCRAARYRLAPGGVGNGCLVAFLPTPCIRGKRRLRGLTAIVPRHGGINVRLRTVCVGLMSCFGPTHCVGLRCPTILL